MLLGLKVNSFSAWLQQPHVTTAVDAGCSSIQTGFCMSQCQAMGARQRRQACAKTARLLPNIRCTVPQRHTYVGSGCSRQSIDNRGRMLYLPFVDAGKERLTPVYQSRAQQREPVRRLLLAAAPDLELHKNDLDWLECEQAVCCHLWYIFSTRKCRMKRRLIEIQVLSRACKILLSGQESSQRAPASWGPQHLAR